MQSGYTFAVQFTNADFASHTTQVKQRLKRASLVYDKSSPGCVLYSPKQPLRLVKLADDLATVAVTSTVTTPSTRADILAELVASNLASKETSSAEKLTSASKGLFKLCRMAAELLLAVLPAQQPSPSPSPSPSPTPSELRGNCLSHNTRGLVITVNAVIKHCCYQPGSAAIC
jgi:hypothetical protein